jgi:hypothetical protein
MPAADQGAARRDSEGPAHTDCSDEGHRAAAATDEYLRTGAW